MVFSGRPHAETLAVHVRGSKGVLQKHTACDQAMSIRPTSVPGRTRFSLSTPRGHIRPDKVGRERPPSERVRDRLRGVAAGVAHAPHHCRLSSHAASEAAKSAALRASRSRGSSVISHARLPLELFAACVCIGASRSVDKGNTAPGSVFPSRAAAERARRERLSCCFCGQPDG